MSQFDCFVEVTSVGVDSPDSTSFLHSAASEAALSAASCVPPVSTAGGLSVHTNTCRCGIEEELHFLMGGHYPFNCTQISLVNN